MRMWMINPELLCRAHLMGEHFELHKFRHDFIKKHSIKKRILRRQIEPINMETRHNQLVEEILKRGYNHNSPYKQPDLSHLKEHELNCKAHKEWNLIELSEKCPECRKRIKGVEKCYYPT